MSGALADPPARGTGGASITRGVLGPVRAGPPGRPTDTLQLVVPAGGPRPARLLIRTPDEACPQPGGHEAILLNVPLGALSLEPGVLRGLMFRPLPVPAPALAALRSAAAHVLGEGGALPDAAVHHYLLGVAELLLRGVLDAEPEHAGSAGARQQALDHLAAHLADTGLTAQRVAEALHMSRRRLYQLFDGELGVRGTIREMRVAKARRLLVDAQYTGWSVDRVARACGFASRSHFSRIFAAATGLSPRDYRAQQSER